MKKLWNHKAATLALLLAAFAVLSFSTIQGSRAALSYVSEDYTAGVEIKEIDVALVENGTVLAEDAALLSALPETPVVGQVYEERLAVSNTGAMNEYVRVILRRYWQDENGKRTELSPSLIQPELTDDWILDESATTEERLVLYYSRPLAPGEISTPLCEGLCVDASLAELCTTTETKTSEGYTIYETVFDYNGVSLVLEASAEGVQTHNAASAIKSAWGVDVTLAADGCLNLN